MDYDAMLKELGVRAVAKQPEATREQVMRAARAMAANGYDHTMLSLEALRLYLSGYALALFGDVGTGKTHFFRCLAGKVVIMPIIDVVGARIEDVRDFLARNLNSEIVIDDVGAESVYNEFGSRYELLPWIVSKRMESGKRTHFTTNMTAGELLERYGRRVVDRMRQMAKQVTFVGPSRRRTDRNAEAVAEIERQANPDPAEWALCRERCARAASGGGCAAGMTVPPDRRAPPRPPRECVCFLAVDETEEGKRKENEK